MCSPPSLSAGERGRMYLQPNFRKAGGLTGPQLLEGGWWGLGVGGVAMFYIKSEIFSEKMFISKNIFLS